MNVPNLAGSLRRIGINSVYINLWEAAGPHCPAECERDIVTASLREWRVHVQQQMRGGEHWAPSNLLGISLPALLPVYHSLSLSLCWIRLVYNLSFSLPFTSSLSSHHPAALSSTICLPPSSPLSPSITSLAISRFYSAISFLSLPLSLFVVHFPSFRPQTIWALSPPTTLLYIVNQGMATLLINYIDGKFLRILSDPSKLRYIAYS